MNDDHDIIYQGEYELEFRDKVAREVFLQGLADSALDLSAADAPHFAIAMLAKNSVILANALWRELYPRD